MAVRTHLLLALLIALAGCPEPPPDDDDDVTEPAPPGAWADPFERLDGWDGGSFAELADLEVRGDQVIFCTGVQGLQVWSIADPTNLSKLDELAPSGGSSQYPRCQHVSFGDDDRIYVSNRSDSIQSTPFLSIVDASTPTALSELGSFVPDYSPEGHTVRGDQLYVAGHTAGLVIYDRGDGAELTELARVPTDNAWNVRVVDSVAWVADGSAGLVTVDVSSPAAPQALATLPLPGPAKDLAILDTTLYVGLGAGGVAAVDMTDPSNPALLSVVDTPGSALGVAVGAGALYVADWNDLRVFDLSNPALPALVGHEPLPLDSAVESRTLGVAATGDLVLSGGWTELVSYRYFPDRSAPDIVMGPRFLQLGVIEAGEEGGGLITVSNDGNEPLRIDEIELRGEGLSLSGVAAGDTLAPGASITLVVDYGPASGAAWQGDVVLHTDDPDEPQSLVCVRANAGGLQPGSEFPGRTWLNASGEPIASADHAGEVILLAYFATF